MLLGFLSSCISCTRRLSQLARVTSCESTLTIVISSDEKLFFFDVVSTPFVHLAALFKTHQRWSPSSGGSALLCVGIEMATNLRDYPMSVALEC